jgi:DME family drug/metabolite transporter
MTANAERIKGMLLVMTASMSWGTTGILQALAPEGTHPLTVGAVRVVLASFVLMLYVKWKGGSVIAILRKPPLFFLAITAIGVMGYQFTFFPALLLTGVSVGSMIAIGAAPVIAGIMGAVFEREPLSGRWFLSTAIAIIGCALLLGFGSSKDMAVNAKGASLAFLAAFCYATLGLGMKRLGTCLDTVETATAATTASLVFGLPALILFNPMWIFTPRGLAVASALGVLTEALPMCFFAVGLKKIFLRDAYTLSLFEPLTACGLSALILGERLAPLPLFGAVLILCGIFLLSTDPRNRKQEGQAEPAS